MDANALQATPLSIFLTFILVVISISISYKEKLKLEKDIVIAAVRATVQLIIVGFVLREVFQLDNNWVTFAMIAVILLNAAWNSKQRGAAFDRSFFISLFALTLTTVGTLTLLVLIEAIKFQPSQIVPLAGTIAGNSMTAIGLSFSSLENLYHDNQEKILEKIALGATPRQASQRIIKKSISNGLIPIIDKARALGIVTFPGTMNGLLFAGVSPLIAVAYQIMIIFTQISTATLSSYLVTILSYQSLFTDRAELKNLPKEGNNE